MSYFKSRAVPVGSLVLKSLGIDQGMYGIVLDVILKEKTLPYYLVVTHENKITQWMTPFVDLINSPDEDPPKVT